MALDTAWPWANDTYGLCCLRAYFCAHKLIRARSYVAIPQIGIAMGFLLQIRMSWLRALSKGVWCCGVSWLSARSSRAASGAGAAAGVVSWQSAPVLVSADCARCGGKLAVQAAYILVPASRMSTGRGILPRCLGLCWCHTYISNLISFF